MREQRDVLAALAQRAAARSRPPAAGSRDPRGSGPVSTSLRRSRLVAAMMRTSTRARSRTSRAAGSPRPAARAAAAPACPACVSPTSSRKIVPPSATSKRPFLSACAPVKAPRLWPKSSLSSSVSGSARAVLGDEALVLARPRVVDRARDQVLAGAGLAGDQHRGVGLGHLLASPRTPASWRGLEPMIWSKAVATLDLAPQREVLRCAAARWPPRARRRAGRSRSRSS